jgi:hypothetical protein
MAILIPDKVAIEYFIKKRGFFSSQTSSVSQENLVSICRITTPVNNSRISILFSVHGTQAEVDRVSYQKTKQL